MPLMTEIPENWREPAARMVTSLRGLDRVLAEKTGMKVTLLEDPTSAVVTGGGQVLENLKKYKNALVPLRSFI